jgi:prephenate dehydrogenase
LSRWAAVAAVVQQMEHLLCRQRHSVGVLDTFPAEACAQRAAGEDFRYIRSAMRLAMARVYVYCTICVCNTAIQIAQWAPLAQQAVSAKPPSCLPACSPGDGTVHCSQERIFCWRGPCL